MVGVTEIDAREQELKTTVKGDSVHENCKRKSEDILTETENTLKQQSSTNQDRK